MYTWMCVGGKVSRGSIRRCMCLWKQVIEVRRAACSQKRILTSLPLFFQPSTPFPQSMCNVYQASLVPEADKEGSFSPVLNSVIAPLRQMCHVACAELDAFGKSIFMANNISAMQVRPSAG